MSVELSCLVLGLILLILGVAPLHRLPVTPAMACLAAGLVLGPTGIFLGLTDPETHSGLLWRAAEITVVVSLFTVGLKFPLGLGHRGWRRPVGLASISMVLTVALITLTGVLLLDLPLGAAVLLGAVLAPTDPVLASDIQVRNPTDKHALRLALTGEAGLNDGTAFPFVMLGLGLLGLHELGDGGLRWWAVDVVWAISSGLALGAVLGAASAGLLHRLTRKLPASPRSEECVLLGLVGTSYGGAILMHAYGFLAVFAAGIAFRAMDGRMVRRRSGPRRGDGDSTPAKPAHLSEQLLTINERLEHLLEVATVLLVGAALTSTRWSFEGLWLAPLLLLVIRPLAVAPVIFHGSLSPLHKVAIAWFGIRGIGSIYYLMYAVHHGLPTALAEQLIQIVLTIVAISVVVHGVSPAGFKRALH